MRPTTYVGFSRLGNPIRFKKREHGLPGLSRWSRRRVRSDRLFGQEILQHRGYDCCHARRNGITIPADRSSRLGGCDHICQRHVNIPAEIPAVRRSADRCRLDHPDRFRLYRAKIARFRHGWDHGLSRSTPERSGAGKARFYSPYITQFTQPDTIVPDPQNPQAWNRYSYVLNNPIRYTDPSGHKICLDDGYCGKISDYGYQKHIYSEAITGVYKWKLKGDWSLKELKAIYQTGRDIETYADGLTGGNGLDWMHFALGNTTIEHVDFADGHSDTMPFLGENFGPRIRLNDNWLNDTWGAEVVLAHELGHVWDINSGFTYSGEMNRNLGGSSWCFFCSPGNGVPQWKSDYHPTKSGDAYGNSARNEYFAEAFSAAVYSPGDVPAGVSEWIRLQMLQDVLRYLFPGGLQ